MMYHISRFLLGLFYKALLKVKIMGKENIPDAPYLVVSNHASLADPPFVGEACKKDAVDFMAKAELFDFPVLGSWTRSAGCIRVDRGAASARSLKEAMKRLALGRVVAIFPEGKRSEDGNLQQAKRGVGFLIAKAKVPVLPIYIEGSNKAFPKGGPLKIGTLVNVYVGKPMMPEEFIEEGQELVKDYEKVAVKVMDRIASLRK